VTTLGSSPITDRDIERLVRRFYGKARLDPTIGPVFERAIDDWEAHIATLTAFWSSVMLATGRYKGDPLGAHAPHGLQPDWFPIWLTLWSQTAHEELPTEVAELFVEKAERIGRSLSLGLFFDPRSAARP
jgi:hemoglobin